MMRMTAIEAARSFSEVLVRVASGEVVEIHAQQPASVDAVLAPRPRAGVVGSGRLHAKGRKCSLPSRASHKPLAAPPRALAELLGQPDEQPLRPSDVAESVGVLILDHVADELRASSAEPGQRLVDVLDGEHDA